MRFNAVIHTLYLDTFQAKIKNVEVSETIHFCNTFFNHETLTIFFSNLMHFIPLIAF